MALRDQAGRREEGGKIGASHFGDQGGGRTVDTWDLWFRVMGLLIWMSSLEFGQAKPIGSRAERRRTRSMAINAGAHQAEEKVS